MSLLNTRVQELRLNSPTIDQYTNRHSRYGGLDAFLMGNQEPGSIITPEIQNAAAVSSGRDIKIPVFDSESISITTGSRPVTITDSENTSQLLAVTRTIYSWGFTMVPARYRNNEIGMQKDFERKMFKYIYKLADTLDTACIASLNTNKSQVFANDLGHTPASNVLTATDANKDRFFGDLSVIMKANDYFGMPYKLITNAGGEAIVRQQEKYGQFNEQNKTLEWADKTLHFTNNITDDVAHQATGYIVNPQSLGMTFTHEADAVDNRILPDGTEWSIETMPFLNIPVSTYFYYGRADKSALGGAETAHLERTAVEYYGFSIEVGNVVAYIDDLSTVASPVAKWRIADA